MATDIAKILFQEAEILRRLDVMAEEITRDYMDKDLTVVAILNGSFIFMADRWVPENLQASSYVWLPLEICGGELRVRWRDSWSLSDGWQA